MLYCCTVCDCVCVFCSIVLQGHISSHISSPIYAISCSVEHSYRGIRSGHHAYDITSKPPPAPPRSSALRTQPSTQNNKDTRNMTSARDSTGLLRVIQDQHPELHHRAGAADSSAPAHEATPLQMRTERRKLNAQVRTRAEPMAFPASVGLL